MISIHSKEVDDWSIGAYIADCLLSRLASQPLLPGSEVGRRLSHAVARSNMSLCHFGRLQGAVLVLSILSFLLPQLLWHLSA